MNANMKPLGKKALCEGALCGVATLLRLKNGGYIGLVAHDVETLVAADQQLNPDDHAPLMVSKMRHVLLAPQSHSFVVDGAGEVGNVVNAAPVWPLTTWWELEGADLYEPSNFEQEVA